MTLVETAGDPPPEVAAVAATLRTVAGWVSEDDRDMFYAAAKQTEHDWDGPCCPVCEEVMCDDGCPLERVRLARRSGDCNTLT